MQSITKNSKRSVQDWTATDFRVEHLGACKHESKLPYAQGPGPKRVNISSPLSAPHLDSVHMERADPPAMLYFDPSETTAAIVTCGGLCPGMNDVIRGLVNCLQYTYGVKKVLGLRWGFQGLTKSDNPQHQPLTLDAEQPPCRGAQNFGGTILGTSRGPQEMKEMVEFVREQGIDILFAIGGDGTMRGVDALGTALKESGTEVALVGIPKTIDNDIPFTDRTFGFETAVEQARGVLACAHTEAHSSEGGIGLVKLMGRESGFVAAMACVASGEANLCLIPEMPFSFEKVNAFVRSRLEKKGHAVVVVAEGAGQDLLPKTGALDASGNKVLQDIGVVLKQQLGDYLKKEGIVHTIKYFDPSYIVRSSPANTGDALYCCALAKAAVHAAMAGKTNMFVTMLSNSIVCLPTHVVNAGRKVMDLHGSMFQHLLETTGMPHKLT